MADNSSQILQRREPYVWALSEDSLFLCIVMSTLAVIVLLQNLSEQEKVKAPTVRFYGRLIPDIFSRLRFNSSAPTVIFQGYEKVADTLVNGGKKLIAT